MIPKIGDDKISPYGTDRRSASRKLNSDIRVSEYPIITKAAYSAMLARETADVNEKIKWLAMGRIRLGHTLMAVSRAIHFHNPKTKGGDDSTRKLYQKLKAQERDIERLLLAYPLEVR
jgi:hypothetical protein